MQDFTGVPAIVDLAALRDAVAEAGLDPQVIRTHVPCGSGGRPFGADRLLGSRMRLN